MPAAPLDPNSPEALKHANDIYGVNGTAMTKPSPDSTWNAANESWDTPGPAWMKDPQWAHLDPRLSALYVKHNRAPAGAGTGFTDANYWNEKIASDPSYDFIGRLDKDLAGTGTDRSTGTVWGAAGAPAGVDSNATPVNSGAQLAGLVGGGQFGSLDVLSQGTGPGSYAWRQAQIYALQQRLANGFSK